MKNSGYEDVIMNSIRAIVRDLRIQSRKSEKDLGISGAQLFVLQKLGETSGVSINELAERTLTHQSSVSTVVAKLIKGGFVSRVPSEKDRRQVLVSLTKKGQGVLKRSPLTTQERLLKGMSGLSERELEELATLLRAMLKMGGFQDLSGVEVPLFFEESSGARVPKKERKKARRSGP